MANALTVAGSDSVGGAGLQADLKAFEAVGVHGCSVVTCVTSQNTRGVSSIFPVPTNAIASQLESVLEDVTLDAVKTGMLYSGEIVKTVADRLKGVDAPLVVDPVLASTTGSALHESGFLEALVTDLLPISTLVTPNLEEAKALSGIQVQDEKSAQQAGFEILELGPEAVLIKGGHLKGKGAADYLCKDGKVVRIESPRVDAEVHGTGCALASLIAGNMALGLELEDAVRSSKSMIFKAILERETVGKGSTCANPLAVLRIEAGKVDILREVDKAADSIEGLMDFELIPEVGTNLGYALAGATGPEEVAALEGRIVRSGLKARRVGCARFGASKHVARIVLAASSVNPDVRCAMNVKYSAQNLSACREADLSVSSFDRSKEPDGVSSMTWGVEEAIRVKGSVPDVIFDEGGEGKEPMIRILGRSPEDVVSKLKRLATSRHEG